MEGVASGLYGTVDGFTGGFALQRGSFFKRFFGTVSGCGKGAQRVAKGGRFGSLFRTVRVPVGIPCFCIDFWLFLGCPGSRKSCVFYVRVFKNRLSALLENVQKTTPKMSRFRYPFEAKISLLGVPENNTKIGTPKLLKWCQK